MREDLRAEWSATVPFPPGETRPSLARTRRFANDPLPMLLDAYERYGPVFTLRIFHGNVVFMLGPAANHYITVSHASNFTWRDSHFRDLIGLMGDGLLTIDGDFHRRSRLIMLPAFHREHILASAETVIDETVRAVEQLDPRQHRRPVRVDPSPGGARGHAGALRRRPRRSAGARDRRRGPVRRSALLLLHRVLPARPARAAQPVGAPAARRAQARHADLLRDLAPTGDRRARKDILSLLLDGHDEDGNALSDLQIRDEVMTLLFAGHDTTTSTVSFMFYELARHPEIRRPPARRAGRSAARAGGPPASQLVSGELPELEMVFEETLRKYPPAWVGPRRSVEAFEFEGHTVPARAFVNYCSWASHHLPDVFPEPEEFRPERFAPEAAAALPKGAYVPFGGGSRTCIGMRFGQLEVRAIATLILSRCTLSLPPDFTLRIRQMPTISPKDGLPVVVRPRIPAAARVPAVA